jgi:hypothetical protein
MDICSIQIKENITPHCAINMECNYWIRMSISNHTLMIGHEVILDCVGPLNFSMLINLHLYI